MASFMAFLLDATGELLLKTDKRFENNCFLQKEALKKPPDRSPGVCFNQDFFPNSLFLPKLDGVESP